MKVEQFFNERFYGFSIGEIFFFNKQFGFGLENSTLSTLAEMLKHFRFAIYSMFPSIAFDLRKTLDNFHRSSSIKKLERCGVRGVYMDWFISHL